MSRSTHKFARLDVLAWKGKLGSVLVQLMMVVNDMSLAMDAQRRWSEDAGKQRAHRERGAKIYFVRLQISHIFEAMKIIEEIRDDPDLMRVVDRSGGRTQKAFAQLLAFKGSAEFKMMAASAIISPSTMIQRRSNSPSPHSLRSTPTQRDRFHSVTNRTTGFSSPATWWGTAQLSGRYSRFRRGRMSPPKPTGLSCAFMKSCKCLAASPEASFGKIRDRAFALCSRLTTCSRNCRIPPNSTNR